MSSSVLPLYMLPTMTSIQPAWGRGGFGSDMEDARYLCVRRVSTIRVSTKPRDDGRVRMPRKRLKLRVRFLAREARMCDRRGLAPAPWMGVNVVMNGGGGIPVS